MCRIIIFLVTFIMFIFPGRISAWGKYYEGASFGWVLQSYDENILLCGNYHTDTITSSFLLKTDGNGDTLWCWESGISQNFINRFIQDYDSTFVSCGVVEIPEYDRNDACVIRFSSDGDSIWSRTYISPLVNPNSTIWGIAQMPDSGFVLAGGLDYDWLTGYIFRIDKYGDTIWTKIYDWGTYYNMFTDVATRDDGVIAAIATMDWGSVFIMLNEDGDSIYAVDFPPLFPTDAELTLKNIITCRDNGFCMVGYENPGSLYIWEVKVIRTDSTGTIVWNRKLQIPGESYGISIFELDDGHFGIVGYNKGFSGEFSAPFAAEIDEYGDTVWSHILIDDTIHTSIYSGALCRNGDYLLVGSATIDSDNYGVVIRLDSLGNCVPFSGIAEKIILKKINLFVYPNPFNSSCKIIVPADAEVEIYDIRGNVVVGATRWVAQQEGDATHRPYIWTPDKSISSGIYFVRAIAGNGNSITKRIIYLK